MPCHACVVSHVQLLVTPWTVAHQVFLSMGFPRQEYWSSLPFSSPGALPDWRTKPTSLVSSALAGGFLTTMPPGKPCDIIQLIYYVHFLFPLVRIWTSWEKWFLSVLLTDEFSVSKQPQCLVGAQQTVCWPWTYHQEVSGQQSFGESPPPAIWGKVK